MQAGLLDRRVTLLRKTVTRGEANAPEEIWSSLATVWASRRDVTDIERLRADEIGAVLTTRFQIRYSPTVADLTPADRLSCDGRTYNIEGIRQLGREEGLEINASTRADGNLI